jgi:hypothetical protein
VYKQILRSVKLTTGKKGQKIEWTGRGLLRRRRSALDCSATEEEEEEVTITCACELTNFAVVKVMVIL